MTIYNIPSLSPCHRSSWNFLSALNLWTQFFFFTLLKAFQANTRDLHKFDYGNFHAHALIALHEGKTIFCKIHETVFFAVLDMNRIRKENTGTIHNSIKCFFTRFRSLPVMRFYFSFPSAFLSKKNTYNVFLYGFAIRSRNTQVYINLNFYISCMFA